MTLTTVEREIISNGLPPSREAEMEFALEALIANKNRWVQMGIPERIQLLDELVAGVKGIAERWVAYSHTAKGLPADHPQVSEDWVFVSIMFRQLRTLQRSLDEIAEKGHPALAGELRTARDGRVIAPVFPITGGDKLLYTGITGEVWFNPDVSREEVLVRQAHGYLNPPRTGKISLVLGAGNVSMLVPADFLYKLFVEQQVVLLKMNPVNEYLGPLIEEGYKALIEPGFLRVVYGGVEQAQYLINHPAIDELHMTGSDDTHDAIVFGVGGQGERNKKNREPIMTKRFTSELGNISPVIVVPGAWSARDLRYWGRAIATHVILNAGFNCLTPRVVIQHAEWDQRETLIAEIDQMFAETPPRPAYYPKSQQIQVDFTETYPDAHLHGKAVPGSLPWTFIPDIDANDTESMAFKREAFCGLTTETAISADDVVSYIQKAIAFCNDTLWGTLSATIVVHPDSMKDPQIAEAVEQAVADLRYGTVGLNLFGSEGYILQTTSWGGHSGQDIFDVQSGIGVVNNMLLFDEDHIQKSVIRGPFRSAILGNDPNDRGFKALAKQLAYFEAEPSWISGLRVAWALVAKN